jgi:alpha-beta hydrolase superfamily lysophospholipase
MRGNGRSSGKRGHVARFRDYLLDLKRFMAHIALKKSAFILGHSLGGLIAIRYAMEYPEDLCGIITTSPALGLSLKVPLWKQAVCYGLNLIRPDFAMVDRSVPSMYLSHDPHIPSAYDEDPLVHRLRSVRFFVEFIRACSKTMRDAGRLKAPCLFLQAGDDKIVSRDALVKFYNKVPATAKMIKIYPRLYHEILNETEKETVFNDIQRWLGSL